MRMRQYDHLRAELAGSGIGVSLLCPGLTRSRLNASRSTALGMPSRQESRLSGLLDCVAMPADQVGLRTIRRIEDNEPWIFTHSEFNDEICQVQAQLLADLWPRREDDAQFPPG
jgi:short-subunit dehydrogenase